MLLAIDVGNTNTVIAAMQEDKVSFRWRITTSNRTTDEFGLLLLEMLQHRGLTPENIEGVCISCVVPSVQYSLEKACRRYVKRDALVIGRGIRTGMRVRTDNPREVGADRIVNAVGAFVAYGGPVVVVDFGTATTFDCVNAEGDYLGGAIAPGFGISAEALFLRAAKLPKVEVEQTDRVIGANTIESMQAGLYWGYVGLVQELARRCKSELSAICNIEQSAIRCVATGGLARLVGQQCEEIHQVDDHLTMRGLRELYERNSSKVH